MRKPRRHGSHQQNGSFLNSGLPSTPWNSAVSSGWACALIYRFQRNDNRAVCPSARGTVWHDVTKRLPLSAQNAERILQKPVTAVGDCDELPSEKLIIHSFLLPRRVSASLPALSFMLHDIYSFYASWLQLAILPQFVYPRLCSLSH